MPKSFCTGCAHWQLIDDNRGLRFHACLLHSVYSIADRKRLCYGKENTICHMGNSPVISPNFS